MTKIQRQTILEEMKRTVRNIRDAEKNADAYYSAETIKRNMSNYFCGLAFALEIETGREYHWSNGVNGNEWAVVEIVKEKEIRHSVG